MKYLVVDANVVFSSLLKGSALFLLLELKKKGIKLITPQFLLEEFVSNINELSKALGISNEEAILSFGKLLRIIEIIPKEKYSKFSEKVKKISPDKKDVLLHAVYIKK